MTRRADDGPFVALMFHLEMGATTLPPELVRELLAAWRDYLAADGALSLEDALIGKAKRRAGNYSKRWHTQIRDAWIAVTHGGLVCRGLSQEAAAENLIADYALDLDVETIVKIARNNRLSITPTRKREPAK